MSMVEQKKTDQELRTWAAISYLWVLSVLVLILKKDKFVQAHAKQGLLLFIGEVLMIVPGIGWIIGLLSIILAVIGFIKAYSGDEWEVPLIGAAWAKKINL